jgi:hypothetical protein
MEIVVRPVDEDERAFPHRVSGLVDGIEECSIGLLLCLRRNACGKDGYGYEAIQLV